MDATDVACFAHYCRDHLDLSAVAPDDGFGYASVPLCVIDAVFSIGASTNSTDNTVRRFCDYFGTALTAGDGPPLSVSAFIRLHDGRGPEEMAARVYRNRQRTSTRNGILKAKAVLQFSEVLAAFGVEQLPDVDRVRGDAAFEAAIRAIAGQGSGISLRYFYMLTGSESDVKPDRMIGRFVQAALGRSLGVEETAVLLAETCALLAQTYPNLTPRKLDNLIWEYQRGR